MRREQYIRVNFNNPFILRTSKSFGGRMESMHESV
jgi:hypothetical protein